MAGPLEPQSVEQQGFQQQGRLALQRAEPLEPASLQVPLLAVRAEPPPRALEKRATAEAPQAALEQ
jgi:hypothetical protein